MENIKLKDEKNKGKKLIVTEFENEPAPPSWATLKKLGIGISWAWKDWLPKGFVTMLVGQVGLGKSTLALRICASYLTAMDWLDGSPFSEETGYVIWCEAESGHFMNLDRADRWNLPIEKILTPLEDAFEDFNLSNPEHRKALEEKINKNNVKMVIIDSLRGAIEGDENNSEFMKQLKYLANLAKNTQIPFLVVHHLRKKTKSDSTVSIGIDRIRGSSAIAQFPRMVMAIDIPNEDFPDKRKLQVIKNNLGKYANPIGITITDHGIEIASDIESIGRPQKTTQRESAKEFLKELLKDGSKSSLEVYKKGAEKGLDKQTLQRAKKELGINARKRETNWEWGYFHDDQPTLIPQ